MRRERRNNHPRNALAVVAAIAVMGLVVGGCSDDRRDRLDVFAAASLVEAFTEMAAAFEQVEPGVEVRLNFAGSSTLREQVRDGAGADVFASANLAVMEQLVADGSVRGESAVMAYNRIVLAVPAGNAAGVDELADLADPDRFVGVCAPGVPCGDLAAELVAAAGVELVADTEESNVRSLTRRLSDVELDAALVYATDVAASGGAIVQIPFGDAGPTSGAGPAAAYPIAVVDPGHGAAGRFVDFVLSDAGAAILEKWAFETPTTNATEVP